MIRIDKERGRSRDQNSKTGSNADGQDLIDKIPLEFEDEGLAQEGGVIRIDGGVKSQGFRRRELTLRRSKELLAREAPFRGTSRRQPDSPSRFACNIVRSRKEPRVEIGDGRDEPPAHRCIGLCLPIREGRTLAPSFRGSDQIIFRARAHRPRQQIVEGHQAVQKSQADVGPVRRHNPKHSLLGRGMQMGERGGPAQRSLQTATNRRAANSLLQLPIPLNQRRRRTIMLQIRIAGIFNLAEDLGGQHFPQLHAPLVESIDLPDRRLGKDRVLIQSD